MPKSGIHPPTEYEATVYVGHFIRLQNKTEAYLRAFPKTKASRESIYGMACRFHAHEIIDQTIQSMQEKALKMAEDEALFSAKTALEELEEARDIAKKGEQPAAMVAATMGKSKVVGLLIDKKEVKAQVGVSNLTPEEAAIISNELDDEC